MKRFSRYQCWLAPVSMSLFLAMSPNTQATVAATKNSPKRIPALNRERGSVTSIRTTPQELLGKWTITELARGSYGEGKSEAMSRRYDGKKISTAGGQKGQTIEFFESRLEFGGKKVSCEKPVGFYIPEPSNMFYSEENVASSVERERYSLAKDFGEILALCKPKSGIPLKLENISSLAEIHFSSNFDSSQCIESGKSKRIYIPWAYLLVDDDTIIAGESGIYWYCLKRENTSK